MSFVSPEFAFAALLFFPVYWALHARKVPQLVFLAIASYLLYASWSTDGALVLFAYSLGIWLAGDVLNRVEKLPPRKLLLLVGLACSLVVLLITKYYDFLRQIVIELLPALGLENLLPVVDIVAPAGISFYTFQAVTYLVWRYRSPRQFIGPLKPLTFLAFWPTLFAGPILRADDFFRQMGEGKGLPLDVRRAVLLIFLGLAQKMVFASWLAETYVDEAFRYPDKLDALSGIAAIWGYSLQIFLDFSGYSLIVTGLALLLGYRVPINFRQPYMATDLREFWHRWHISLSTFIRDYVYIPLGGNSKGFVRTQANVFAAMLISGIWHGANVTFLFWGGLHGLGVMGVNLFRRFARDPMPPLLSQCLTIGYVGFAWVFFRAQSYDEAWQVLSALAVTPTGLNPQFLHLLGFTAIFFALSARVDTLCQWADRLIEKMSGWSLYLAGLASSFAIIFFGPSGIPSFIYYRF